MFQLSIGALWTFLCPFVVKICDLFDMYGETECSGFLTSGMWCVAGWGVTDVVKEHRAYIVRVRQFKKNLLGPSLTTWLLKMKALYSFEMSGTTPPVTSTTLQRTWVFNNTALRASNLVKWMLFVIFRNFYLDLVRSMYASALWSHTVTSFVHKLYSSLTSSMATDFLCFRSCHPPLASIPALVLDWSLAWSWPPPCVVEFNNVWCFTAPSSPYAVMAWCSIEHIQYV